MADTLDIAKIPPPDPELLDEPFAIGEQLTTLDIDPTHILQPYIYIDGIALMEPTTTVTDLLITVVCFLAAWRLKKSPQEGKAFTFLFWFFIITGVATACGGILGHGWAWYFGPQARFIGFSIGMFGVAAIERSSITWANQYIHSPALQKFFLVLNLVEITFMLIYCAITLHFKWVEFHSVYGFLVVVLGFHGYTYYKVRDQGSKFFLLNTINLLLVAYVFNAPVIIDEWFNHRDLAHVLMCVSMYILLLGGLNLGKRPGDKLVYW